MAGLRTMACAGVGAAALVAGAFWIGQPAGAAAPAGKAPAMKCAALLGKFGTDGEVTMAEQQVAPGEVGFMGMMKLKVPGNHCLVRGSIAKRTGVDGKPYAIGFELRLPDDWNGRFMFQGGGGHDGMLFPAVGFMAGAGALERGFAVVSTDGGHLMSGKPGETGDYGFDPQARVDYGYNAMDRTAVAAKAMIQRYYGAPIRHSYFAGCSNGGRQAMMASQRFPTYFDGIVAGAPGFRLTELGAASVYRDQALAPFAPKKANGDPDLDKSLSQAALKLTADAVVAQCDELDGLKDGIIHNQAACKFDPAKLQCKESQTSGCLTKDEVTMVKAVNGPTTTPSGKLIYVAPPWDSGIGDPAWRMTRVSSPLGNPRASARDQFVAFLTPPQPDANPFTYDMEKWPTQVAAMSALTNPTSTDLSAFKKRGGKIIYYHGVSDQIMSVRDTELYYEELAKRNGGVDQTQSFARLFVVPGMLHCSGGAATDKFDMLTEIVNWVEKGQAPARIIAQGGAAFPGRSRPLCPYPTYAHYKGGDPEKAESFECRTN